jgi:hypothetical protein
MTDGTELFKIEEYIKSLVDNIVEGGVDYRLYLLDEIIRDLVLFIRHLHVPPNSIELFFGDGHMLVRFGHGSTLVVVGSSEHHAKKVSDQMVEH